METSAEQNSRTVRGSKRKSSSLAAHDAIEVITGALEEDYGQLRAAAKHIARDADRTEKAVRNWLEKKNLPDALSLLRLMQKSAAVRAAVNALTGADGDPAIEREFLRFQQTVLRMMEEKRGR